MYWQHWQYCCQCLRNGAARRKEKQMNKKEQQRIADALSVFRQTGALSALSGVVPYAVNGSYVVAKAPMPQPQHAEVEKDKQVK